LSKRAKLERYGGINEFSELAKTPSKTLLTCAEWTSGLLVLAVSPLSPYQQQLIDRIQTLSQDGWTDRQIAKHFNDRSMLTPRGHRWIAQSVFSMRTKWEKRLARISGKS
jgi:hypothetical protein